MDPKHNDPPRKPDGDDKKPKNLAATILISLAILLAVISIFNFVDSSKYTETTYSDFVDEMNANKLEEVEIKYDRIIYMTREEAAKDAKKQKACYTGLPFGDVLAMAQELGYKTVFWSLAYVDWNNDAQPTKEEAFAKLLPRTHNGAVVLLHSTSRTNADILEELIGKWKDMGYRFGTLEELFA